jgi:hypothetical protein
MKSMKNQLGKTYGRSLILWTVATWFFKMNHTIEPLGLSHRVVANYPDPVVACVSEVF